MSFLNLFRRKQSREPELKEETRCVQGEAQVEVVELTEQGSNLFIALKLIQAIEAGKLKRYQGIEQFLDKFKSEFTRLEEVQDDYDSVELKFTPELKKLQTLFINRQYKCDDTKLSETIMKLH